MSIDSGEWLTGPQVQRYFNVTSMTIWRWMRDERLAFPAPTKIRQRNYWRLADIHEFEKRMIAQSLSTRGCASLPTVHKAPTA